MSQEQEKDARDGRGTDRAPKGKGRLAAWQIIVLVVTVLVMAGGIALGVVGSGESQGAPASATSSSSGASDLVRGFAPTGSGDRAAPATADKDGVSWSPVVFRLGFSAFVGFAVGFALRSFLRFSVFALGFFFLLLLGLQYAQIIEIHWGAMEDRYNEASSWISAQTSGFMGFITGQLPAAGLGVAGLLAGLKR